MAGVFRIQSAFLRRLLPQINKRLISTSKKNADSAVAEVTETVTKTKAKKNWISYGFDKKSEEADLNALHSVMFAAVTVCLIFGGFIMSYAPDYSLHDWAQREAFLELRRREDAGLPLISKDLIDPSKIVLPSDEELGDTEIII
ncbi:NADH dehydrogenase [ubiquinone] 1 beta subcomplex subunit 11, mitochondrial [Atheta coriaria]|uniref:NADH dehydrogenase [ubiquinone] 1 beta subcomplex subunit 11, mitochondrial n=1 Tax=Dalotia coriaria TaxID=877792 RepID=UPI0031F3CB93